ncbi:MAG: prepilin-type N-terminal cleavage/methylation domain-containing protein [Burkholderiales bacterium]
MTERQRGFTLTEMAIVLIIMGLLLGGILKGQEMIVQAKIKNLVADFTGISAAYHGYADRYRAVPGDDPAAATRWTTPTAATSGDGDGQVAGTYNNGNATCVAGVESCDWWDHLRRGGFVAGSGQIQPRNVATGLIGVQTGDGASPVGPALGGAGGAGGFFSLIQCSSELPDKFATALDIQMDDGVRTTGAMRGILQSAPSPAIPADATQPAVGGTDSYVESGTNVYTICRALQG